MFVEFNPNPEGKKVGDCVVRAISKATGLDWEQAYVGIAIQGFLLHDMPSSNQVWGAFLRDKGFVKKMIPDTCPDCYTIRDFCGEYFVGTFVVGTGTHAVACIDGRYYDAWDSGDEAPLFYWELKEEIQDDL